ncbi:maturation protein [Escherichia phage Qbeta]|nr:A2 maturation protein [Escherichia phage Qbeta]AEQ25540.1 maturation protein [Escherichia phage Qbeta]
MPKLPRGLRFGADNEILNDFQELWFPDLFIESSDTHPWYTLKGRVLNAHLDDRLPNVGGRQVRRTPHRVTVPIASSGLRPVTTVQYDPAALSFLLNARVDWDFGNGDSANLVINDFLFRTFAPKEFDFSNSLVPRYTQAFSAFNAKYGTMIGEGLETIKYLGLLLRRLREGYRAVKRGDLRALRRVIQSYHNGKWKPATAGNLWLEFRYGLMPLFYDIRDVMLDWQNRHDKIQRLLRFSVGHGEDYVVEFDNLYPAVAYFKLKGEITLERRHRHGISYANREGYAVFDNGSLRPVSDWKELATAFINPHEVAWELTPYSFVVDWFLNVGDILAQQGQLYHNIDIVDGFDRRDIRLKSFTIKGERNGRPVNVSASLSAVDLFYSRLHTSNLPFATLDLDTTFSSFKHVLDSISLLTQRVKR